jgi:hypothetical protein
MYCLLTLLVMTSVLCIIPLHMGGLAHLLSTLYVTKRPFTDASQSDAARSLVFRLFFMTIIEHIGTTCVELERSIMSGILTMKPSVT